LAERFQFRLERVKTRIALFRGINVGGRHRLPMKELVSLLEDLGCRNARTYIQSGNAVFECGERESARLAERISAEVRKRLGFEPSVLLMGIGEFEKAMRQNPFREAETDPKSLHVSFLAATPKQPDMERLDALRKDSERFRLIGRVFYLHAPEGVGRSKLAAAAERCLGVQMTDRNWRTLCRIRELTKS
jgi:uncharacterized protein (DUF1697 family)